MSSNSSYLKTNKEVMLQQESLIKNKDKLFEYIRKNQIGSNQFIKSPYGKKRILYADYTASGRYLEFIEIFIKEQVKYSHIQQPFLQILPFYANTHSNSSWAPVQTSFYREETRNIIKQYINASDRDSLIFCGSGSTAAINKLINALNLKKICTSVKLQLKHNNNPHSDQNYCIKNRFGTFDCTLCQVVIATTGKYSQHEQSQMHKHNLQNKRQSLQTYSYKQLPQVFISIFEHTSNLVPWRQAGCEIIIIGMDKDGDFNYQQLQQKLKQSHELNKNCLRIGSFSAGSNLTGQYFDTDRIAYILHKYSALAFFDYACVAPYCKINMNGRSYPNSAQMDKEHLFQKLCYKDAVFISPHKFVGGPGSPGILCAKQNMMMSKGSPQSPGGGTVFFVNQSQHLYFLNVEEREEGGTPPIVWEIRAGLAFQLKAAVGEEVIYQRDNYIHERVMKRFKSMPNLVLLGNNKMNKLPIYIFMIKSFGYYLHYNFTSLLLNDLFGIQTRGGCACAAMFGQKLLGLDLLQTRIFKGLLCEGLEQFRVGYTRINFCYFWDDETIDFVLDTIQFVCNYGWMFLPHYKLITETSEWVNRLFDKQTKRSWLSSIDYSSGEMKYSQNTTFVKDQEAIGYFSIEEAKINLLETLKSYRNIYGKSNLDQRKLFPQHAEEYRWFLLPSQVLDKIFNFLESECGKRDIQFEDCEKLNEFEGKWLSMDLKIKFQPMNFDEVIEIQKITSEVKEEFCPNNEDNNQVSKINEQILEEKDEEQSKQQSMTNGQIPSKQSASSFVKFVQFTPQQIKQLSSNKKSTQLPKPSQDKNPKQKDFSTVVIDPKSLSPKIPKKITHLVGDALITYDMITPGSKVMIALSGGKDSLSLIHILRHFQKKSPVKFDLAACTIDPEVAEFDPSPLIPYLEKLQIPYFYVKDPIVQRAQTCMQNNSICSFCSRMKRGLLYTTARKNGYNVIAMGQHLDDLAQSFMMSSFHNGLLRTMKANYTVNDGDLRVIRPLVFCREKLFKDFAEKACLPVIPENCPACFSAPKERHRIKILLAQQEHEFPNLFQNLLKTMKPIMKGDLSKLIDGSKDEDMDI